MKNASSALSQINAYKPDGMKIKSRNAFANKISLTDHESSQNSYGNSHLKLN